MPHDYQRALEHLNGLLDELREAGFVIGPDQYVSLHGLLLRLASLDRLPGDGEGLKRLVGPVVCCSPKEQAIFRSHFDEWYDRNSNCGIATTLVRDSRPQAGHEDTKIDERLRSSAYLHVQFVSYALGVSVVVILFLVWLLPGTTQTLPSTSVVDIPLDESVTDNRSDNEVSERVVNRTQPDGRTTTGYLFGTAASAIFGVLLLRWWSRRVVDLYLVRQRTSEEPVLERITVASERSGLFDSASLFRSCQQLRRHLLVPGSAIDVPRTVEATIRSGGAFVPVNRMRSVLPEYLILIERSSYDDQLACLITELSDQLSENGVYLDEYYYDIDPRCCTLGNAANETVTLGQLAAQFPCHRLIVFGSASNFVNSFNGRIADWIDIVESWPERALMTLSRPSEWGSAETLASAIFRVLPAGVRGISLLIGEGVALPMARDASEGVPLPESLRDRPLTWLDDAEPYEEAFDGLSRHLREYIGEDGRFWLSACAVYPEIRWNIVVHLGKSLSGRDGQPLMNESRLLAIARLPWFRFGRMPDWLRRHLVDELTMRQEAEIQKALQLLFVSALDCGDRRADLMIAKSDLPNSLGRAVLRKIYRSAQSGGSARDHVFATFMCAPLGVRLPRRVRGLIALRPRVTTPAMLHLMGRTLTKCMKKAAWAPLSYLQTLLQNWAVTAVATVVGIVLVAGLLYSLIPSFDGNVVLGRVTLDDQPLKDAAISFTTFFTTSTGGRTGIEASGLINEDGTYVVTTMEGGMDPGKYIVTFAPVKPEPDEVIEQLQRQYLEGQGLGGALEQYQNLNAEDPTSSATRKKTIGQLPPGTIPMKYRATNTSKLSVEVVDGRNEFSFELTSKVSVPSPPVVPAPEPVVAPAVGIVRVQFTHNRRKLSRVVKLTATLNGKSLDAKNGTVEFVGVPSDRNFRLRLYGLIQSDIVDQTFTVRAQPASKATTISLDF